MRRDGWGALPGPDQQGESLRNKLQTMSPRPDLKIMKLLACINLSLYHYLVLALRRVHAFYNSSFVSVKLSSLFLRSFDNCDVDICLIYLLGMLWYRNLQN